MTIEHIETEDELKDLIEETDHPVIVDYWAEWCGPCKSIAPVFEELAEETDSLTFAKANIEKANELAQDQKVMSIPTFSVYEESLEDRESLVGSNSEELRELVERYA